MVLGQAYICGVVSSGPAPPECGRAPGAYIKVADEGILKWIQEHVNIGPTSRRSKVFP